jgi:hypothetical protein
VPQHAAAYPIGEIVNDRLPLAAHLHEHTPNGTTAPADRPGTVGHMTTHPEPGTVTLSLTLTLTESLADALAGIRHHNFYEEQADRFELLGGFDLPLPNDAVFVGGTMNFCDSISNALLLRAYEQGCGHTVTMLWDLGTDEYVVLSSRRFAWGGSA